MEMNFNNFTVSQLFTITDVKTDVLPSVNISSKNVPSRHGTIFQGAQIGERRITVSIMFKKDYNYQIDEDGTPRASEFQNYIRSIVYYLQTDEPKKLIFSDEPDRYYWAICTGIEVDRMLKMGQGSITFTCSDPYLYSTEEYLYEQDEVDGLWHVDNRGTVESHPRVRVEFNSDATYLGVISPESVIQLGRVGGTDESNKTYKYKDNLKTMNNWYYGSQATMSTDCQFDPNITVTCTGEVMKPSLVQYSESDAPQSPYNYKGTQMMTTLDTKYRSKYFNARLQFDFMSSNASVRDPSQVGAIQIHLLDINNNVIAMCGMNDHDKTVELTNPYIKLGNTTVWSDSPKLPTPTIKKYTKVFDSEDDLPADANLVKSYERNKGYSKAHVDANNAPVFKGSVVTYKSVKQAYQASERYYDKATKKYKYRTVTKYKYVKVENPMKKLKQGDTYRVKSTKSGWVCIYLNSKCTQVGWIQNKYVTVTEPETETVYVYTRKIYPDKNIGKYTDLWGYFRVIRAPHSNGKGDIWTLEMYRFKTTKGVTKAVKLMSKKITESTGKKYTSAGALAKVAVTFVSRKDGKPISRMSFNYLEVTTMNEYGEEYESEPHIIAGAGDVIEIDYSVPSVELNGESILEEVDIGSRFSPLQPFMQTDMAIDSDAEFNAEVYLTEKFL